MKKLSGNKGRIDLCVQMRPRRPGFVLAHVRNLHGTEKLFGNKGRIGRMKTQRPLRPSAEGLSLGRMAGVTPFRGFPNASKPPGRKLRKD